MHYTCKVKAHFVLSEEANAFKLSAQLCSKSAYTVVYGESFLPFFIVLLHVTTVYYRTKQHILHERLLHFTICHSCHTLVRDDFVHNKKS